jgi:ferrous iron transport protein B
LGCHAADGAEVQIQDDELKILLIGNPNVGKSVIFSKLTGMDVMTANYTGTTVTYTMGNVQFIRRKGVVIDVPGTYSLEATSPAEKVAVDFLNNATPDDVIICVLDATNLERNLNLALQVKEYGLPTIFALNLIDVAETQGIIIDVEKLEEELGAPVIPTVAIRNIGLRELLFKSWEIVEKHDKKPIEKLNEKERWDEVRRITNIVQITEDREATFLEKLGDMTLKPWPGLPIAAFVLLISLGVVVGLGKGLRALVFLPIVNNIVVPFMTKIVSLFVTEGILFNVLVGEYGVLVKGIEWPFALILPYVFLFYIVLSFLEDSGYLPRLGVLVDGVLSKLGIHGGNIVPLIMGYGCAIPAILGTKASTSYKERIMVSVLVSVAVPCAAQTGAFISLLGDHSILLLVSVYILSFIALAASGIILNKIVDGTPEPMLLEIPNLLMPDIQSLLKKIWFRTKGFMVEAEVPMLLGVGFAALVAETGILNSISHIVEPLVTNWLGLPKEATLGLLLGIIRRELAVLPLLEMNLSTLQLFVGAVVALFYIPCLSVVGVLIKEFGLKFAITISAITVFIAFLFGGIFNHIGNFLLLL